MQDKMCLGRLMTYMNPSSFQSGKWYQLLEGGEHSILYQNEVRQCGVNWFVHTCIHIVLANNLFYCFSPKRSESLPKEKKDNIGASDFFNYILLVLLYFFS